MQAISTKVDNYNVRVVKLIQTVVITYHPPRCRPSRYRRPSPRCRPPPRCCPRL